MNFDVATYIEQLLFEHNSVIIPDLGGFVSSYRSASIDNVQGLLHPPSKSLSFNKNLIISDGILINHIAQKNDLNETEAKEFVAKYVEQTNEILNRREIVVFPGVGRLYMDYEGNLQFLQDSTNFNADSFGLESVQFYPILRNKATAPNEAPVPVVQKHSTKLRQESQAVRFLQSAMPLLAGLALVAFGLTFYMFDNDNSTADYSYATTAPKKMPVVDKRVNEKPTRHQAGIMEIIDERNGVEENHLEAENTPEVEETDTKIGNEAFDTEIDTESMTLGPNQKEGVIIIGTYNYKSSVQKMVNEIYELGYDVYKAKKGNSRATRVGVQFVYEDDEELDAVLKRVKRKIDDRAWVLKR